MFALMNEYAMLTIPIEEAVVIDAVLTLSRKNSGDYSDTLTTMSPEQLSALKHDLTERITQDFNNLKFINSIL